jgi:hypothetical protein
VDATRHSSQTTPDPSPAHGAYRSSAPARRRRRGCRVLGATIAAFSPNPPGSRHRRRQRSLLSAIGRRRSQRKHAARRASHAGSSEGAGVGAKWELFPLGPRTLHGTQPATGPERTAPRRPSAGPVSGPSRHHRGFLPKPPGEPPPSIRPPVRIEGNGPLLGGHTPSGSGKTPERTHAVTLPPPLNVRFVAPRPTAATIGARCA